MKAPPWDNLTAHKALTLAESGNVLVIVTDGYTEAGLWGEILSRSAMTHSINGTIVDGGFATANNRDDRVLVFPRSTSPAGGIETLIWFN